MRQLLSYLSQSPEKLYSVQLSDYYNHAAVKIDQVPVIERLAAFINQNI